MSEAWTVVVTTEPEWDGHTAGQAEGLEHYDQDCCPGCGLHQSVLEDPEHHHFEFDESTCPVCSAQAMKQRLLADADEAWDKRHLNESAKPGSRASEQDARRRRPYDGRHVRLRQLSPLEVLAQQTRSR